LKLSLSNGIFSKLSLEQNLSTIKQLGFENVEFNMKAVEKQTHDSPLPAQKIIENNRLKCLTLHSATFPVSEEKEVGTAVYYGTISLDFAHTLGAPVMVIHSNVSRELPENLRAKFLNKVFSEINAHAKCLKVKLALENLSYASGGFGKNVEQIEEILNVIDPEEEMGVTLDFCHSTGAGTTESLLEKYDKRLCNIHISNRAHSPFTEETPKLTAFLQDLKRYGYKGPLTMELSRKCTLAEVAQTKKVIEGTLSKLNV
jgi:sugar phosphate isomerase/epimerase